MSREYILKEDGTFWRRPFALKVDGEEELNFDAALLPSLNVGVVRKMSNVFSIGDGSPVGVSPTEADGSALLSLELRTLTLRATIKATPEKIVIPSFEADGDFVSLEWKLPPDMRLFFCPYACNGVTSIGVPFVCERVYLFAFHKSVAYKLPLPNTYSDCRLCTGVSSPGVRANTLQEIVQAHRDNFVKSKWNNHLIHDGQNKGAFAMSQKLLRFVPTDTGFDWIKPEEHHWTAYCVKVGMDILNHVAL